MQEYYTEKFKKFRDNIKEYFGPDTCAGGLAEFDEDCPSKGQCVPTAAYVNDMFGGHFVSTKVDGVSHWYSRVFLYEQWWFVDLTGDQFGYPEVQFSKEPLYENTIRRKKSELTEEALNRIELFKERVDNG